MKAMKIKDIINVVNPKYVYLKLTPNNSIRNQSTHKIAKIIASLYGSLLQRIKVEEKKLVQKFGKDFFIGTKYSFSKPSKVGYLVYIEKSKVEFYFIVPDIYESIIREKLSDVWSGVTVESINEPPYFKETSAKYYLQYDKEDALSLASDRRNNDLLKSNLNIINVLEDGDKVGIFYNFVPTSQGYWKNEYKHTMVKVKKNEPVDKNKSKPMFILKYSLAFIISITSEMLLSLTDKKSDDNESIFNNFARKISGMVDISEHTVKKENATILKTQIIVLSESESKVRKFNNAKSLTQSFDTIADDNRLIAKKFKKKFNYTDHLLKQATVNSISDIECSNFISLAGRDILDEYNFIDKVNTSETKVPEDLREGNFRVGVSTYRGNKQEAFLTDHSEYKHLSLFLIGPARSGKTTLIGNLSYDAIDNDECVILFDFIENCEMSTQVANLFPKEKVLNIVCDDKDTAQGLGYNEIRYSNDHDKQYINAKTQATQLSTLINSVNVDDAPLTARMKRYLASASLVVFLDGGPVKDVFSVLQNHVTRHSYIEKIKKEQLENMREYLDYLYELDEKDSKTGEVKGSKLSAVEGIISRLNLLKDNPYMELMLKKNTENNVDLVSEMEQNKLISIKMPESMFNTDEERDVYCIYWITKIWLALQVRATLIPDRDKRKKVNLFVDEMYQVQHTEAFMSEKLNRFPKFRMKPIISCHYLGQLKYMKRELAGANASYMLLSGCDEDNFTELASNLKPFVQEDLINLPEHHSLNLLKNKEGYGKFISKMPLPVEKWLKQKELKEIEQKGLQAEENNVLLTQGRKTTSQTTLRGVD